MTGGWTGRRKGRKPPARKPKQPRPTATAIGLPTIYNPTPKKGKRAAPSHRVTRARDAKLVRSGSGRYTTKLTREVISRLEQALASGAAPADAAPFAGISRRTFQEWMALGRIENADPLYVEFVEMVEQSSSSWAIGMWAGLTKKIRDGESTPDQTLKALRARGFAPPEKEIVAIGNEGGDPFKMLVAHFDPTKLADFSDDDLALLKGLLEKARAESNVIDIASRRAISR